MAKKIFLNGSLSLNGTVYGITNANVGDETKLNDVTDLSDDDVNAEISSSQPIGATKFTLSSDLWRDFAKPEIRSKTSYDAILTIETDVYTGKFYIRSITKNASYDAIVRYSLNGSFSGRLIV